MRNTITKSMIMLLLLVTVGCASTKHAPVAVDQTGRELPTPHYILKTTDSRFNVLFYWAYYTSNRDLDGSIQSDPHYFDYRRKDLKFNTSEISSLVLTIELLNHTGAKYEVWERTVMSDKMGRSIQRGGMLAMSNRKSRQFRFKLPFDPALKEVDFGVDIVDPDTGFPLIHIGDCKYVVKSNWKGGRQEHQRQPF